MARNIKRVTIATAARALSAIRLNISCLLLFTLHRLENLTGVLLKQRFDLLFDDLHKHVRRSRLKIFQS